MPLINPQPDRRLVRLMPTSVEGFRVQRITGYVDTGNQIEVTFELGRVVTVSPLAVSWPDTRIVPAQSRTLNGADYEALYAAEEAAARLVDGRIRVPQALAYIDGKGWFPWMT
jgi:hypothetical protein